MTLKKTCTSSTTLILLVSMEEGGAEGLHKQI